MTAAAGSLPLSNRTRKRRWVIVAVAAGIAGAAVAGYGVRRARIHSAAKYVPPVFVEPGPGPRAPSSEWFGVRLGTTRLGDVRSLTAAWSLTCADRGSRALMAELRQKKRDEIAQATAHGTADTVSGASILTHHSAHDDNPQIRFDCENASSDTLRDRARPASSGRLLFVFDDAGAPVRHVSYQRAHDDWTSALGDFIDATRALSERFGRPVESGTSPVTDLSGETPLPKYARREAAFRFSDVVAKVSIANLGGHGYSVSEIVEVPWPVRADAPAR